MKAHINNGFIDQTLDALNKEDERKATALFERVRDNTLKSLGLNDLADDKDNIGVNANIMIIFVRQETQNIIRYEVDKFFKATGEPSYDHTDAIATDSLFNIQTALLVEDKALLKMHDYIKNAVERCGSTDVEVCK